MAEARYEVTLAADAEADLVSIGAYLAELGSPEIAAKWLAKFLDAVESLEQFPERGRKPMDIEATPHRNYRQLSLRPYRIFYRTEGKTLFVALIADGRRDLKSLLRHRLLSR